MRHGTNVLAPILTLIVHLRQSIDALQFSIGKFQLRKQQFQGFFLIRFFPFCFRDK